MNGEIVKKFSELEKKIFEFEEKIAFLEKNLSAANKKIAELEKTSVQNDISLEDFPGEIWRDVVCYEGLYEVSNKGRVKSFQHKVVKIRIPQKHGEYFALGLSKFGKQKTICIHALVAKAFIPNPENKPFVNHRDGDKYNNCVENLEWSTVAENTQHAYDTGLAKALRGAKNGGAKFTEEQVKEIRSMHIKGDKNFGTCGLARKFNVGTQTIWRIITRQTYKDVN